MLFDFSVPVGFWPFIDDVTSSDVTAVGTHFVPAFPGSNFNVLSFEGHTDSYVALENNGKFNLLQHRNNIWMFIYVIT